jgi:hypothetical protein
MYSSSHNKEADLPDENDIEPIPVLHHNRMQSHANDVYLPLSSTTAAHYHYPGNRRLMQMIEEHKVRKDKEKVCMVLLQCWHMDNAYYSMCLFVCLFVCLTTRYNTTQPHLILCTPILPLISHLVTPSSHLPHSHHLCHLYRHHSYTFTGHLYTITYTR